MRQLLRTWGASLDLSRMLPGQMGLIFGGKRLQVRGLNKHFPEGFIYLCESEVKKEIERQLQEAISTLSVDNVPIGSVLMGVWGSAPSGYVLCDGRLLLREEYPDFWDFADNFISEGQTWGDIWAIDPISVTLPDLRNDFVRMASLQHQLGIQKLDQVQDHGHVFQKPNVSGGGASFGPGNAANHSTAEVTSYTVVRGLIEHNNNGTPRVGNETHPRFTALNLAIKIQ